MRLQLEYQSLARMLKESISLMCKNSLPFDSELSVEGLLGITLDQKNVFLVNIKESFEPARKNAKTEDDEYPSSTATSSRRKRRRRRSSEGFSSDSDGGTGHSGIPSKQRFKEVCSSVGDIDNGGESDEPVVIKEEIFEENQMATMTGDDQGADVGETTPRVFHRSTGDFEEGKEYSHELQQPPLSDSQTVGEDCDSIGRKEGPFQCELCGHAYQHRVSLHRHMRGRHGGGPICKVCGSMFGSLAELEQHQPIHTKVKPYQCSECAASFARKGALLIHSRAKHPELHATCADIHQCVKCGQYFGDRDHLQAHMVVHTDTLNYQCSKCGKKIKHHRSLRRHLERCTGVVERLKKRARKVILKADRVCMCDICGKSFSDIRHLRQHSQKHGTARFQCVKCGRNFKWKTAFHRHCVKTCRQ